MIEILLALAVVFFIGWTLENVSLMAFGGGAFISILIIYAYYLIITGV